jgi:hypothetical protein
MRFAVHFRLTDRRKEAREIRPILKASQSLVDKRTGRFSRRISVRRPRNREFSQFLRPRVRFRLTHSATPLAARTAPVSRCTQSSGILTVALSRDTVGNQPRRPHDRKASGSSYPSKRMTDAACHRLSFSRCNRTSEVIYCGAGESQTRPDRVDVLESQ